MPVFFALVAIVLAVLGYFKVQDYLHPEQVVAREMRAALEKAEELATRRNAIQKQLPPGCIFKDYGNYQREEKGTHYAIFAIHCPHEQVTTKTGWELKRQSGKQTVTDYYDASVTTDQP